MLIQRSALVAHPADDMFGLVRDVDQYPQFLSWCEASEVLEDSVQEQLASLTVRVAGVQQTFTTRNRLKRPESITLQLEDGPFRSLSGAWHFQPLGDDGSKISLTLEFEFAGGLLALPFQHGFAAVADHLLQDFVQRADAVMPGD